MILSLLPSTWSFSFALRRGYLYLVGSNILLLMVVQQQVAILEFSQEKLSAHPSTPPPYLITTRDVLFIIGVWNAKVGSQETLGLTGKFGLGVQNEAGQRLIEFFQENTLVIPNTLFQQHKRRLYTWTSPDGQYQNQIGYILCSQRWRSSIQSAKTRLGITWNPHCQIQT